MPQTLNRLKARQVETITQYGRHSDGGGLYLSVADGGRRWVFRYRDPNTKKVREMGLGAAPGRDRPGVSLADARRKAEDARRLLSQGVDPLGAKQEAKAAVKPIRIPTFKEVADGLIESLRPGWRSEKHASQWEATLDAYAAKLQPMPVNAIATEHVLEALRPIWNEKPETARRVRGRIEAVLAAATAHGHRSGANPAQWRHHLDKLLAKRPKLSRGHHAAMPYDEVPAFVARLREAGSVSALALEFTILTAARSGEVLGAEWSEIDMEKSLWSVPAGRMKSGRRHTVPLSQAALEVLRKVRLVAEGAAVFPGPRDRRRGMSNMALEMTLRRMKVDDVTVHGFRSSFRDWAGDHTAFPRELLETALAHTIRDETERAYRRGDALEKRRQLMAAWADFCAQTQVKNVVPLRGASA
ncbi:integrase [Alsobacter soli]|uniref:Integrase n=1 Tax=Alsobacter soli TaxID=2109933 RepID=A0A2T1HQD0_9HYPH|nr:site-specific integrase [Alsobacter soli]PSC03855.1 integrase [Alsobacter soli]